MSFHPHQEDQKTYRQSIKSFLAATSPYMREQIRRFGRFTLDMEDLPAPLNPQPLPFETPL
jgi:hypothetical protein